MKSTKRNSQNEQHRSMRPEPQSTPREKAEFGDISLEEQYMLAASGRYDDLSTAPVASPAEADGRLPQISDEMARNLVRETNGKPLRPRQK